jgi:hypothetical protein
MTTSELLFTVIVETRATMDRQLAEAEEAARAKALDYGSRGIVITRHNLNLFTVALSNEVPFGLTVEQQLWEPRNSLNSRELVQTQQ